MEITTITTTAPVRVARMVFNLALVAALTFLNCAVLQAETPENEIKLENWMRDFWITMNIADQEIRLESWMTNNNEFIAENEVKVEYWMTDYSEFLAEADVQVENWMTASTLDFATQTVIIKFEDWIVDCCSNDNSFYVRKLN